MKWVILITAVVVLIALYVVVLRPRMQKTAWGAAVLAKIEPIERVLWWKSETILWARLKIVVGILLTLLTQAGSIDITPLMPFIPDQYEGVIKFLWNMLPLTLTVIGWVDEQLRRDTTKPLEVVAMRTDVPEEVKERVAEATAMAKAAVAEVVQADPSVAVNRS
jgi:Na+/proline symporter